MEVELYAQYIASTVKTKKACRVYRNLTLFQQALFFSFFQIVVYDSRGIKHELDVTCYFILLMYSTCFGH